MLRIARIIERLCLSVAPIGCSCTLLFSNTCKTASRLMSIQMDNQDRTAPARTTCPKLRHSRAHLHIDTVARQAEAKHLYDLFVPTCGATTILPTWSECMQDILHACRFNAWLMSNLYAATSLPKGNGLLDTLAHGVLGTA